VTIVATVVSAIFLVSNRSASNASDETTNDDSSGGFVVLCPDDATDHRTGDRAATSAKCAVALSVSRDGHHSDCRKR
jgi:hypothetical protein